MDWLMTPSGERSEWSNKRERVRGLFRSKSDNLFRGRRLGRGEGADDLHSRRGRGVNYFC